MAWGTFAGLAALTAFAGLAGCGAPSASRNTLIDVDSAAVGMASDAAFCFLA